MLHNFVNILKKHWPGDSEGKCGPESSLRFSQEETGQQMGWASLNYLQGSGVEELPLVV